MTEGKEKGGEEVLGVRGDGERVEVREMEGGEGTVWVEEAGEGVGEDEEAEAVEEKGAAVVVGAGAVEIWVAVGACSDAAGDVGAREGLGASVAGRGRWSGRGPW